VTREDLDGLDLKPYTLLKVTWFDIANDSVGDPDRVSLAERVTYGLFWKLAIDEDSEIDCIVLTVSDDKDDSSQQGWWCIPMACLSEIEVIRRPRKKRETKKKEVVPSDPSNS